MNISSQNFRDGRKLNLRERERVKESGKCRKHS